MGVTVRDRSNGTEGSVQRFGVGTLSTSDVKANAGATDAYAGDGNGGNQSIPTVEKAHGVASAPELMRAHQTGTITHADHQDLHSSPMSEPASNGCLMPSPKSASKVENVATHPVVAVPRGNRPPSHDTRNANVMRSRG